MANTNNENNNIGTSNSVKTAFASPTKNNGMRRRKQSDVNSTTEWQESKYVIPPACKYQGNVFSCMNGRLSQRYNPRILCTHDHDNEVGITSWDELMMHRGYENPNGNGVITPMPYENCPHSGCTKIVPSIQTSRKYHLQQDHQDVCITLLKLDVGAETNVIRDLLHTEKLYYTPTGYVITLECKFGADCGNMRADHLEKYTHPKKNCKFNTNCTNKSEEHSTQFVHTMVVSTSATTIKQECKFQPKCTNKSEEHRRQFVHTGATVFKSKTIACAFPTCWNNSDEHNYKYTHRPNQKGVRPTDSLQPYISSTTPTLATIIETIDEININTS